MKKLVLTFLLTVLMGIFVWTPASSAQAPCTPNWTASEYKSFGAIQNEIKKQYGDVRILRVALCGEGGSAYFLVVIISGRGQVQRVQLAASN